MKKIIKILFLSLILNLSHGYSQNLVLNPSFEDTLHIFNNIVGWRDTIPFIIDPYINLFTKNWKDARYITEFYHPVFNTYYYYVHPNTNVVPLVGVPSSFFSNYRIARTGDAFIGHSNTVFWQYDLHNNFYNSCALVEIVTGELKQSLVKDKNYKVSLYVGTTNYRNRLFSNALDIFFSPHFQFFDANETILDSCSCGMIQYPDADLSLDRSVMITDTLGWQKVEFEYIARGDEKFISIGNFRKSKCESDNFDVVELNAQINDNTGRKYSSYFFYDDIAVYPVDAPEYSAHIGIQDTCINKGMPIALGGEHRDEYFYWWYNANDSLISRQSSITVYPTESTSYVLVQKDFKFDETRDTVHIKVGDCLPLPPDYSHYDFAIYPNPNQGDFQVRFNTAVPDGAVLELYDLLGRKIAKYALTGSQNIANISGVDVAPAIYYATVIVPNVFRKSVKMVVIR